MSGDRHAPRRLLWLIDSLTVGGAESLVVPFARRLNRERWELFVVTMKTIAGNPIETRLRGEGVHVTNLHARNLRDLRAFRRLLQFVRENGVELIHAHLTYAAIWASVLSRLTSVPTVATLHVAPPRGSWRKAVRDRLMRLALNRWAARVISVSEALRGQLLARGGLRASRTAVVHNGIEIDRFAGDRAASRARLERELRIPPGLPLLAVVSVLRPGKGIDVLIEAVRSLPECRVLLVGDGPMRSSWTAAAVDAGVADRFVWAGFRTDVEQLLPGCDLLVHPTLEDAFPTVLLEAMAAGLPVVASDVGGVPEIVRPGRTGSLVPPGDARQLSTAIEVLLRAPSRRQSMGEAARERVSEHFSTEAWIARLESVYGEVLA